MDKLRQLGRRALFVVQVITGYEERRIRAYRLQLQKQIEQAQVRKAALRKAPEQLILSEVRRMVEEMQNLKRCLEETEAAIDEYFKPTDKNVEMIMNMQLDREEKNMKEMVRAMQQQALLRKNASEQVPKSCTSDGNRPVEDLKNL